MARIPPVSRRASLGTGEIRIALGSIIAKAAKEVIKPPFSLKVKLA
jgi:hypothetical protein